MKTTIKNLNQLKLALREMPRFEIVDHWKPDCIGEIRRVVSINTVSLYSAVDGQPGHKNSLANNGAGVCLWFGKAAEWSFSDGVCSVYFRNRPHLRENLIMSFRLFDEEAA